MHGRSVPDMLVAKLPDQGGGDGGCMLVALDEQCMWLCMVLSSYCSDYWDLLQCRSLLLVLVPGCHGS
jgi:hypothetical protein